MRVGGPHRGAHQGRKQLIATVKKTDQEKRGDLRNQLFPPLGYGKQSYCDGECIERNGIGKWDMKVKECPSVQQPNQTK